MPPLTVSPDAPAKPGTPVRIASLDVLRGVAVLLVLGRHFINVDSGPSALRFLLRRWCAVGWIGVDLFFVLSGFLISGLLFEEYRQTETLRAWRFLGRRGFKIYPPFYALFLVGWLAFGKDMPRINLLHETTFLMNYAPGIWAHTWSLAVEEHFYLGLTLLLWAMARLGRSPNPFQSLPKVCVVVLALVLALRFRQFSIAPIGYLLLPTHFRVDALFFGTLLAYYWAFRRQAFARWIRRRASWILGVCSILLLPCILLPLEGNFIVNTVGLTANYLGFGGLVMLAVAASADQSTPSLAAEGLARIGFYSYSIYLWHVPVALVTAGLLPRRIGWPATIAAYIGGSLVIGMIAAKLIELPFLRLRERVLPSRPRNAARFPATIVPSILC